MGRRRRRRSRSTKPLRHRRPQPRDLVVADAALAHGVLVLFAHAVGRKRAVRRNVPQRGLEDVEVQTLDAVPVLELAAAELRRRYLDHRHQRVRQVEVVLVQDEERDFVGCGCSCG